MERMSSARSLLSWVVTQNSLCPLLYQRMTSLIFLNYAGWMTRKALKEGRLYLNQEQVDRFFARKAQKAAGEGGMELPEGLEEFLLSCQDSM